jgi:tetratricopeptide (TPR) repeat protein
MTRAQIVALILAMGVALGPATIVAQDSGAKTATELNNEAKARFKKLSASAQKKYGAGDYEGAIADFEAAYEIKPTSNILYNIGRIHEQQGNIDEAIAYYDRFVVAPNVEIKARQDAVNRLRTLKEVRDLRDAETAKQSKAQEDAARKNARKNAQKNVANSKVAASPQPDRTAAWVLVGISATTLVGAGVFGVLTSVKHEEYEEAVTLQARRDAAGSGETFGYVADGLFLTGVVTGALGAVLWLLATPDESDGVDVTAGVSADGATVGLSWSFE